ncbi:MAG: efflux RND transporter periplasmic adaptor subunit [Deferribacteres bacterium]|nr:efflux RND transporter periplasmic adaptor subunit [candidate division KSB1 bacterium]MCB9501172.1 efflux RND transporter periplasmic adaptor subunit [Deferribacteres bacterium]
MNKKTIWIIVAVVVVIGLIVLNIVLTKNKGTPVDVVKLDTRELKSIVSASGKIQPKISVDISATTPGKVTKVAVEEGDYAEKGQFLLQIDPTTAVSQVEQTRASISAARANFELSEANLEQAQIDYERLEKLFDKKLASPDEVQRSRTEVHVRKASVNAAKEEIARLKAALATAEHQLSQVNIHSDIAGIVTKRNIEEGENVFVGAFNNPATVLLTIADLSVIEALVEVDETDIIDVKVGQPADISVDAYPDSTFAGYVTEVGHSPILGTSGQQQATSFEVIIQLAEDIPNVRSGLSCKAEIRTGYRENVLAVPIQALTLRDDQSLKPKKKKYGNKKAETDSLKNEKENKPYQGVFVANDDKVMFKAVETGIAGDRYFEVVSGLAEGDMVVTGPFSALRKLTNEEAVKTTVKEIE